MDIDELLNRFRNHLMAAGKSPHTIVAYTRDLRQYRSHLLAVKGRKPATTNRQLASLSAFCTWARGEELISANPVEGISQVEEVRPAPEWLDKRGQYVLLRGCRSEGRRGAWPCSP